MSIKPILLEIHKKIIIFWFFETSLYSYNIYLNQVFNIDKNIFQMNDDKKVKLFGHNLIYIIL